MAPVIQQFENGPVTDDDDRVDRHVDRQVDWSVNDGAAQGATRIPPFIFW